MVTDGTGAERGTWTFDKQLDEAETCLYFRYDWFYSMTQMDGTSSVTDRNVCSYDLHIASRTR